MPYKVLICVLAIFYSINVNAQIITTIAGTGVYGHTGDGGPATMAELKLPYSVKLDASCNLYVVDENVVRKIDPNGIITTVAGNGMLGYSGDNGPATAATLNQPIGLATDSHMNLYIADQQNHVIRKIGTNGIITTYVQSGFITPHGIAIDAYDNLYITDIYKNVLYKVDTSGIMAIAAGTGVAGYSGDGSVATDAELNVPAGITIDKEGNIFISATNIIRKINTYGIITTVAGNVTFGSIGDGGLATNTVLFEPDGIATDDSGNLYITEYSMNRIRKVNTSGIISTYAGNGIGGYSGDGGMATNAMLTNPSGVAFDCSGNLLIADLGNGRVRKVNRNNYTGIATVLITKNDITLNPNPNNGIFTINGSLNTIYSERTLFTVTDMVGHIVHKGDIITYNGIISTHVELNKNLPNGMYFLQTESSIESSVSRFLIEK